MSGVDERVETVATRIAEIRAENYQGDVSHKDIEWLCFRVERLAAAVAGLEQRADDAEKAGWAVVSAHYATVGEDVWGKFRLWNAITDLESLLRSSAAAVVSAEPTEEQT